MKIDSRRCVLPRHRHIVDLELEGLVSLSKDISSSNHSQLPPRLHNLLWLRGNTFQKGMIKASNCPPYTRKTYRMTMGGRFGGNLVDLNNWHRVPVWLLATVVAGWARSLLSLGYRIFEVACWNEIRTGIAVGGQCHWYTSEWVR